MFQQGKTYYIQINNMQNPYEYLAAPLSLAFRITLKNSLGGMIYTSSEFDENIETGFTFYEQHDSSIFQITDMEGVP